MRGRNISPLEKEEAVRITKANMIYDESLERIQRTVKSPFNKHEQALPKGYPLLPPKNFFSEKERRLKKEEEVIRQVVSTVENDAAEKSRIVTKAIYDARIHTSGKKMFVNRPLSASELHLASSPLLRHSSSKNVMRF